MTFTKRELAQLREAVSYCVPTYGKVSPPSLSVVEALLGRIDAAIALAKDTYERGERVLEWRIPREQSPTMNTFAGMKVWMKKRLRVELDSQAARLCEAYPNARLHGAKRKRWVRVTRFSIKKVDEVSVDILGGKMPIDSLVRVGVLAEDNQEFLHREAKWEKAQMGQSHLLVEVFECARDEVPVAAPEFRPVEQVKRRQTGFFTKALKQPSKMRGRARII